MSTQPNPKPARIRLTQDFLDFKVGMGYPKGTELVRMPSGQYALEGTRLGQECVAGLFLLEGIYEEI